MGGDDRMTETTGREERAQNRRRRRGTDGSDDSGGSDVQSALRTAASAAAVGAAVGAARAYSSRRHAGDGEPEAAADPDTQDEQVPVEPEQPAAEEPAAEEPESDGPVPEPAQEPQSPGDLRDAVNRARELLRDLRGVDAESVSSVAPADGGWVVGLEVVEVRRIPDSTDVLATYEVQLDNAGGVRRFERVHRYHRSEAARGGRA
jgi:Gas vesicle synthesis protein GvpO